MKKIKTSLLLLTCMSSGAFAYDSGFLARNCVEVTVENNAVPLTRIEKEIKKLNISEKNVLATFSDDQETARIVVSGRNGVPVRLPEGNFGFKINQKILKLTSNQELTSNGISFELMDAEKCQELF